MMQYKSGLDRISFNKEDLLIDSSKYLMFLIASISISSVFYSAAKAPAESIICLYLLFIPAAFSFILTRFPLTLWKMLSCQSALIISPLTMWLFRPFSEAIVAVLLMFVIAIVSLTRRYSHHERSSVSFETLGISATIHALLLVMCATFPSGNLPYILLAHALISLCLFFSARQKYAFETAYGHIANSPTQPSGSVKRQNTLVLILLCIFSFAVIPLVVFFPYSILYSFLLVAVSWILMGLTAIYNFLMSLGVFPEMTEADPVIKEIEDTSTSSGILSVILEYALLIIALAVFSMFLFYGIKKIIVFIIARYRRALPGKLPFQADLIHDEIISLEKKRVKRFRRMDFGKGEEKEVRKLYYKSVKKEIRSGAVITASQSPGEISQIVKKSSGNDLTKLTSRYEQVRYGNESDVQKTHRNREN